MPFGYGSQKSNALPKGYLDPRMLNRLSGANSESYTEFDDPFGLQCLLNHWFVPQLDQLNRRTAGPVGQLEPMVVSSCRRLFRFSSQ